jgi:hypothetical protein
LLWQEKLVENERSSGNGWSEVELGLGGREGYVLDLLDLVPSQHRRKRTTNL